MNTGSQPQPPPNKPSKPGPLSYKQSCEAAISRWQRQFAACQYDGKAFVGPPFRCKLVQQSHGAEHRTSGFRRHPGGFETTYVKEKFDWARQLSDHLDQMDNNHTPHEHVDAKVHTDTSSAELRRTTFREHLPYLRLMNDWLQTSLGTRSLPGIHTTCLSCLHHIPEIVMPCCRQLVCLSCARDVGFVDPDGRLLSSECPYHSSDDGEMPGNVAALAVLKAPSAGLRILTLDGYASADHEESSLTQPVAEACEE